MMKVGVFLYGPMRKYGTRVECDLADGGTIAALRSALRATLSAGSPFADEALLERSVFATSDEVVTDDTLVRASTDYSVLPPVCGG